MCLFLWTKRFDFWNVAYPQISHTCSISPVCVSLCFFNSKARLYFLLHTSHWKGLLSVCAIMWLFRCPLETHSLPHTSHLNVSWHFACDTNSDLLPNFSPQEAQSCSLFRLCITVSCVWTTLVIYLLLFMSFFSSVFEGLFVLELITKPSEFPKQWVIISFADLERRKIFMCYKVYFHWTSVQLLY